MEPSNDTPQVDNQPVPSPLSPVQPPDLKSRIDDFVDELAALQAKHELRIEACIGQTEHSIRCVIGYRDMRGTPAENIVV